MYVYLAVPIDHADKSDHVVTSLLMNKLEQAGIPYYAPNRAWAGDPMRHVPAISHVNEAALGSASLVVAYYNGDSVGVPSELTIAAHDDIPAIVITRPEYLSSAMLQRLATGGLYTDTKEVMAEVAKFWSRFLNVASDRAVRGHVLRDSDVLDLPLPAQKNPGDIGLDLYVSDDTSIPPGEFRGVPSRIKVAPPDDYWFMIMGRSSALHGRGLMVIPSVIDSGFRGKLFAMAYNISEVTVEIKRGERIAQLIPMHNIPFAFFDAVTLPDSKRGAGGFGSTGR